MSSTVTEGPLSIAGELHAFVADELLPGLDIEPARFWSALAQILAGFEPRNRDLLRRRDELQAQLGAWHLAHRGAAFEPEAYQRFLREIGYLEPEPAQVRVTSDRLDPEIAAVAGPQLVVPVINARYALNAANARWGSLYDALYGADALAAPIDTRGYDPARGAQVIAFGRRFLDEVAPLSGASHADIVAYAVEDDALVARQAEGSAVRLLQPSQFVGWTGEAAAPTAVLLSHNGLHVEIRIDRSTPIGDGDRAGVSDLVVEAALTAIQDCEDSVAAVDAADKVEVYRNWLGLMRGDLQARFPKGDGFTTRSLAPDRRYAAPGGGDLVLPGRSLMLVRNVGHHMTTDAVLLNGAPISETALDALVTATAALYDLREGPGQGRNSRAGSVYIVKPKLHGPDEAALANWLFDQVEDALGLQRHTLKLGLMDEERRTSANLAASIGAASGRIVFINTGFLDRTGDEIHSVMELGPVLRKDEMKGAAWLKAYEQRNVRIGLNSGFVGHGQIGKGMWAMPDRMAEMLQTKGAQLQAGASTAWVPSPTAAVIHALHYHQVDVAEVQARLSGEAPAGLDQLLTPPLAPPSNWSPEVVREELDANTQSILGYVSRWVCQGVGCSKVPDRHGVGLMEDRATLRISSQHIANWLHHGVCDETAVRDSLRRMARVVDEQNAADPEHSAFGEDPEANLAFQAAQDLIFQGRDEPNGYTERVLHSRRRQFKAVA